MMLVFFMKKEMIFCILFGTFAKYHYFCGRCYVCLT